MYCVHASVLLHLNTIQEQWPAAAEKTSKAFIPPSELFKSEHATDNSTQFDQNGVPRMQKPVSESITGEEAQIRN
jgi:hypothetical protein